MAESNIFERHPVLTLTIAVCVGVGILLAAAETYFALTNKYVSVPGQNRVIRLREHSPGRSDYVGPDATTLRTADSLDPGLHRLSIDNNGFIEPSRIHDEAELTIVFLGGSTTEGLLLDEAARFPYLVGRLIERRGPTTNSFNSGVSGNNTLHSINILLNKIVPMVPDYVVLMHNINDLGVLLYEESYWNDNYYRSLIVTSEPPRPLFDIAKWIKDALIPNLYTRLKQFVDVRGVFSPVVDEFAHVRGTNIIVDTPRLTEQFATALRLFTSICRTYGIEPVLMTQANRLTSAPDAIIRDAIEEFVGSVGVDYESYRAIYLNFNDTIRAVAQEEGVLLIDLAALIPQDNTHMIDAVHFSEHGAAVAAELIAGRLLEARNSAVTP